MKDGTELLGGLSGGPVSILVRKIDKDLTISYKNQADEWIVVHSTEWNRSTSLVGFFTTGSPDKPSIGYVSELTLEPFIPVGVDQLESADLFVYPNPVNNAINIIGREDVKRIMLMNSEGRILQDTTDCDKLSIENLSNGIYVLKIVRANGHYEWHKIIVKR